MNVIFTYKDWEWCYDFDTTIPAIGDKMELWFKVGEDLELVFATVMSRKWILSPGTDKDRECPYVVADVEPCEEIPEGAIADSELWPADEEDEE
jgi:hypothetical protein